MKTTRTLAALPLVLLMVVAYMASAFLGVLVDAVSGETLSHHLFGA